MMRVRIGLGIRVQAFILSAGFCRWSSRKQNHDHRDGRLDALRAQLVNVAHPLTERERKCKGSPRHVPDFPRIDQRNAELGKAPARMRDSLCHILWVKTGLHSRRVLSFRFEKRSAPQAENVPCLALVPCILVLRT